MNCECGCGGQVESPGKRFLPIGSPAITIDYANEKR